jgi:hypothetical protein
LFISGKITGQHLHPSIGQYLCQAVAFIGSALLMYLKCSGEKLGIPLKLIISPSVNVSPILKLYHAIQYHLDKRCLFLSFLQKKAFGLENFKFFF